MPDDPTARHAVAETPFGPVIRVLLFGGELSPEFAKQVADSVLRGFARPRLP